MSSANTQKLGWDAEEECSYSIGVGGAAIGPELRSDRRVDVNEVKWLIEERERGSYISIRGNSTCTVPLVGKAWNIQGPQRLSTG